MRGAIYEGASFHRTMLLEDKLQLLAAAEGPKRRFVLRDKYYGDNSVFTIKINVPFLSKPMYVCPYMSPRLILKNYFSIG